MKQIKNWDVQSHPLLVNYCYTLYLLWSQFMTKRKSYLNENPNARDKMLPNYKSTSQNYLKSSWIIKDNDKIDNST